MNRRRVLELAAASSLLLAGLPPPLSANPASSNQAGRTNRRARPSDPDWPSTGEWNRLKEMVSGRLMKVESPLATCSTNPDAPACQELLHNLRNPFFIGDQVWATQSTGWADPWMSASSV